MPTLKNPVQQIRNYDGNDSNEDYRYLFEYAIKAIFILDYGEALTAEIKGLQD